MTTKLLYSDSSTRRFVEKNVYSYYSQSKNTNVYFVEWIYKHKVKIRLKMSKNQAFKFKKYGKIPSVPLNKKNISNYSIIRHENKTRKSRTKIEKSISKSAYSIKIGDFTYKINFFKNDIFNTQDYEIIKNLVLNYILY